MLQIVAAALSSQAIGECSSAPAATLEAHGGAGQDGIEFPLVGAATPYGGKLAAVSWRIRSGTAEGMRQELLEPCPWSAQAAPAVTCQSTQQS
jgi:hypothetical protein